jgi:hypothetical protein
MKHGIAVPKLRRQIPSNDVLKSDCQSFAIVPLVERGLNAPSTKIQNATEAKGSKDSAPIAVPQQGHEQSAAEECRLQQPVAAKAEKRTSARKRTAIDGPALQQYIKVRDY